MANTCEIAVKTTELNDLLESSFGQFEAISESPECSLSDEETARLIGNLKRLLDFFVQLESKKWISVTKYSDPSSLAAEEF